MKNRAHMCEVCRERLRAENQQSNATYVERGAIERASIWGFLRPLWDSSNEQYNCNVLSFFLKSSIFSWTAFQQSSLVEALALVTSLSDYYTPIIIHPDYQQNPEYHNNRLLEPIIIWLLHNNRKTSLITDYYPIIITDYQCSEACCHASTLNVRCTCLFFHDGVDIDGCEGGFSAEATGIKLIGKVHGQQPILYNCVFFLHLHSCICFAPQISFFFRLSWN